MGGYVGRSGKAVKHFHLDSNYPVSGTWPQRMVISLEELKFLENNS